MRIKSNLSWLIVYFLVFILAFLLTLIYFFLRKYFDSTPPQVELVSPIQFISEHRNRISFKISDFPSKVKYVKVLLTQKEFSETLYDAEVNASELNLDFSIDQAILKKLDEAELFVKLSAIDSSSRQNSTTAIFSFRVDKTPPKIEIVSSPARATETTLYLCIFKVEDSSHLTVNLREGFQSFSALRADLLDPSLPSNLYANFFSGQELIYAEDSAGNVSEAYCRPKQVLSSTKKNHSLDLTHLKNLPISEIRIPELTDLRRKFEDFPNFSLRYPRMEVNFGDYSVNNQPSNYKFYIVQRPEAIKCPVTMQIDHVGIWPDNQKYVIGNLGLGLRLLIAGLAKVFLGAKSVCSPRNDLGISSDYIQIGLIFREAFFNPNLILDSNIFMNQVIYPIAFAKKALGILNLSPLERSVLEQTKGLKH